MSEVNTQLHEAQVLAEYGEYQLEYVRAQLLTKGYEAIGLPALSVWERPVDEDGVVMDFDGQPMHEKTAARLELPVAPFERQRNLIEHNTQKQILDRMTPGQVVVEESGHPNVDDQLARSHGYHPELRYLMKRLYRRTENSVILYNYNIPRGISDGSINQQVVSAETTIEDLLAEYDTRAEAATGQPHFLGEVWDGTGDRDYSVVETRRCQAEAKAERYVQHYERSLAVVGSQLEKGNLSMDQALDWHRRLERGFHTILLVELNPDRAKDELTAEDYSWMQALLTFEPEDIFDAAYLVAERNQLEFIACGGMSEAMHENSWHGGEIKQGICVNCKKGPKPVGRESWCEACISGHCF